jgi:hypothetical protein
MRRLRFLQSARPSVGLPTALTGCANTRIVLFTRRSSPSCRYYAEQIPSQPLRSVPSRGSLPLLQMLAGTAVLSSAITVLYYFTNPDFKKKIDEVLAASKNTVPVRAGIDKVKDTAKRSEASTPFVETDNSIDKPEEPPAPFVETENPIDNAEEPQTPHQVPDASLVGLDGAQAEAPSVSIEGPKTDHHLVDNDIEARATHLPRSEARRTEEHSSVGTTLVPDKFDPIANLEDKGARVVAKTVKELFYLQKEHYEKLLQEKESKMQKKLTSRLSRAQAELQEKLNHDIEARRVALEREFQEALEQERAQMAETIRLLGEQARTEVGMTTSLLEEKFRAFMEQEKTVIVDMLQALRERSATGLQVIRDLADQAQVDAGLFAEQSAYSRYLSRYSLAVGSLSDAIHHRHASSLSLPLQEIEEAAGDRVVVRAALSSCANFADSGVYSPTLLKERFDRMLLHAHRASWVPEEGGLWHHAFAIVHSAFDPPKPALAQGTDTRSVLARAYFYAERDDLLATVNELTALQGLPAELARDWVELAKKRLIAEQAVEMLHADLTTLVAPLL